MYPPLPQVGRQLVDEAPGLKFCIVDAVENEALARGLGVDGFPTLKVIRDGVVTSYNGGFTKEGVLAVPPSC